jgi:outer membrane protein
MNKFSFWRGRVNRGSVFPFHIADSGRGSCILLSLICLGCQAFLSAGCQDHLGTGGSGELVIPNKQLIQIDPLDLHSSIATTQPSTNPSTQPVGPPPPEMSLGIEQCRQMALQNNLDLRVQLFNPPISHTGLTAAEAQFEAVFFTNVSGGTARTAVAPNVLGPRIDTINVDGGLDIPLRTGGTVRIDVPADWARTQTDPTATIWTNNPTISLVQPLLRGGGLYVNTQGIRIAFYEFQRTQALTKLEVIRVLTDVDHAYWQLYAAREALKVRKKEYDSAYAQLERARRQARAGVVADVDVVRAESGVADTVENIIIAENDVRTNQRTLKRILNDPSLPLDAPTILVPTTLPAAFPYDIDPQRLTAAALHQRMEMLDLELQIAEQTSNVLVARNSLLPLVTLQYQYGVSGLGRSGNQSWNMIWEKTPDSHQLALQVQIPIGNESARSNLRAAMLRRMQLLTSREQETLQIRQEIADASDTLQTDWQRIVAAHERVVLSSRTYDVEVRQFNLGLRTSTDVLIAQTDLANAQLAEVSAISDYQIAQVDIAFATGTVLGASHVDWEPVAEPSVPRY